VAAREGGSGAAPSQKFIKKIRKIYSFKCVNFFIKDWLIYLLYVNNIHVLYAKVADSNLILSGVSAISFIVFILLFGVGGQL
jgi:predicted Zn-dependent protease